MRITLYIYSVCMYDNSKYVFFFFTFITASHNFKISLSWLRQCACHCLHKQYLQQEIGSSDVASVSVTRWQAVRTGSELPLPVPTSLPSTKPLPDLVICCEIKARHGLPKNWRIHLPRVSVHSENGVNNVEFIEIPPCGLFKQGHHCTED